MAPGSAAALAGADHIDRFHLLEDFANGQHLADFWSWRVLRDGIRECSVAARNWPWGHLDAGGLTLAAAIRNQVGRDWPRSCRVAFRRGLVLETQLHGVVAIARLIANEQDRARPDLQNGNRLELARFVINLRHSDF